MQNLAALPEAPGRRGAVGPGKRRRRPGGGLGSGARHWAAGAGCGGRTVTGAPLASDWLDRNSHAVVPLLN